MTTFHSSVVTGKPTAHLNTTLPTPFVVIRFDEGAPSYISIATVAEAQQWIDAFAEARTLLIDAQSKPAEVTND